MTKKLTWKEHIEIFDNSVQQLKELIKKENLKIDAIVPIFRGGGFLANYIAYQMSVLRILPVQYKYLFPNKKEQIAKLIKFLFTPSIEKLGKAPTLVLVEGDYCYENTSIEAARDLKKVFPKSTIIFVADQMDYTYKNLMKKEVEYIISGRYTNHCEELSSKKCEELGIWPISEAAWENSEEENAIIKTEQYQYQDLKNVEKNSKTKFSVTFDELQNLQKKQK
jgi:hypothetical protein